MKTLAPDFTATKSLSDRIAAHPVLVLNPYYTGIGIARNLVHLGVAVHALYANSAAPGRRSRFFESAIQIPDSRDAREDLVRALKALAPRFPGKPVLFPTRDFDVLFLDAHRAELEEAFLLPQGATVANVLDKNWLARTAERCGVDLPATRICRSREDVAEFVETVGLPIIMKPVSATDWRGDHAWRQVGSRKAIIAYDNAELLAAYDQVARVNARVLLQEYVEGTDSDIVVFCCYIDRAGEPAGYFTARKILQDPPLFGTGCVVQLEDIPEIVDPALRLLREAGFTGLAEVEFKYDRARYALIEVNPRHWDQHELGTGAGINLSELAYLDAIGMPSRKVQPKYSPDVRTIWIAEREYVLQRLRRFSRGGSGGEKGTAATLPGQAQAPAGGSRQRKTRRIFGILKLSDPVPAIGLAVAIVNELVRSLLRKRRSHTGT